MPGVAMNGGIVDVQIPVSASSFNGNERELGVKVNGGPEMTPRVPLTAVPYAFRVDRVASAELDDQIELGTATADGRLGVWDNTNDLQSIELKGGDHRISTYGSDGLEQIRLWGPTWGEIQLFDTGDNDMTVELSATKGIFTDTGGQIRLFGPSGGLRTFLQGTSSQGQMLLYNSAQNVSLQALGSNGELDAEYRVNLPVA